MTTVAARLLDEGIRSILAGQPARALHLLQQAVVHDPNNEAAWLWLSGVSPTPEEALQALEQVLKINPTHERALQNLRAARIQAALAALDAQNPQAAWQWLWQAVEQEPDREELWWLLARVGAAFDPARAVRCLERLLELNPGHEPARHGLAWYQTVLATGGKIPKTVPEMAMPLHGYTGSAASPAETRKIQKSSAQTHRTARPASSSAFPASPASTVATTRPATPVATPAPRASVGPAPWLLLIVPETTHQERLSQGLASAGFQVRIADQARAALRLIQVHQAPCLILYDPDTPGVAEISLSDCLDHHPDARGAARIRLHSRWSCWRSWWDRSAAEVTLLKTCTTQELIDAVQSVLGSAPRRGRSLEPTRPLRA